VPYWTEKQAQDATVFRKFAYSKTDRFRLRKEAEILSSIHHPRIPRLLDFDEGRTHSELIAQFIPGVSMGSLLRNGEAVPDAWRSEITEAVESLHYSGWNHADIKPANILIHGSDAYLVDLDSAARHGEPYSTIPDRSFTPSFAAWRQVAGRGEVSVSDDLFSLALTDFVGSYRRHPFNGHSIFEFFLLGADRLSNMVSKFGKDLMERVCQQYEVMCRLEPSPVETVSPNWRKVRK
tara:strand:+ start:231 stop:938 length:708 start_codon:yes stop_codon:yes gene_type:complete